MDKKAKVAVETAANNVKNENPPRTAKDSSESAMDWTNFLKLNPKGKTMAIPENLILIAENDPSLQTISYDVFSERFVAADDSPFRPRKTQYLNDASLADISRHIESRYGIRISVASMEERMLSIIQRLRAIHPVKDFINAEKWDGIPRVDTLLIDYLGAEDTQLNRAVTRKWMAAAVARIYEPGKKFDHVLTLAGPQGTGKSTLLATLAGQWFSDTFSFSMDYRQQREAVRTKWIVEAAELSGLRKAEVEAAKAFISATEDSYRAAYAHTLDTHPRQCVLAATTNEEFFLRSLTGDRRWWVVDVKGNDSVAKWLPNLMANVHQLWAEAYCLYINGEKLYLPDDLENEARKMQTKHNYITGSEIKGEIEAWINTLLPRDWEEKGLEWRRNYFRFDHLSIFPPEIRRDYVCVSEVKNEFPGYDKQSSQVIGKILDDLEGWKRLNQSRNFGIYGPQRAWKRVDEKKPKE